MFLGGVNISACQLKIGWKIGLLCRGEFFWVQKNGTNPEENRKKLKITGQNPYNCGQQSGRVSEEVFLQQIIYPS